MSSRICDSIRRTSFQPRLSSRYVNPFSLPFMPLTRRPSFSFDSSQWSRSRRRGCSSIRASIVASLRLSRTFTGCPSRTARMPRESSPSSRLSTATLESATARMVPRSCFAQASRMRTPVWVFPVPGGPWIRVRRRSRAASAASLWALLRSGAREVGLERATFSSGISDAVPAGSWTKPSSRSRNGTPPSSSKIEFRASRILSCATLLAPLSILQVPLRRSVGASGRTMRMKKRVRLLTIASTGFSDSGLWRLSITISPCLKRCIPKAWRSRLSSLTIRCPNSQPSVFATKLNSAIPFAASLPSGHSRSRFSVVANSSSNSHLIKFR